jgi:glyoxylase-like metal-dependent hydrolase (beta-lactamase superfamily II)
MEGSMTAGWFEVVWHRDGIGWIQEPLVKSFLIEGERDLAVLDTGMGFGDVAAVVAAASAKDPLVLHTHAHWDHIGASHAFTRVLVHPSEAGALRAGISHEEFRPMVERFADQLNLLPDFDPDTAHIPGAAPTGELRDGTTIDLGGRSLEIYETPGHSPGGVSFLDRQAGALFTGDAINLNRMLLCLPGSDPAAYRDTLGRIVALAEQVDTVYVCHGDPVSAADVRAVRDAYEEIWAGRAPSAHDTFDLGRQRHPCDIYDIGRFRFLLTAGAGA